MAGNPFINSIIKKNRQGGDPRFGRFGAGGQAAQQNQYPHGQYHQNPYGAQYSSEPQQYQGGYPQGYGQPEYQNQPGYDQQYAQQPGYSPVIEGERLTMNDVIMKTGLSLAVVGPTPFAFNASRYTQEELAARHRNTDLTPSGSTVLCLDAAMAGIGSNSCGPALRPRYQVDSQELGMELHLLLNPLFTHASTHNEVTL